MDKNGFEYGTFPVWQPGEWNSICILASADRATLEYHLNGQTVFQTKKYNGVFMETEANVILMNEGRFWSESGLPMKGSMTDVNIWSGLLSSEKIRNVEYQPPTCLILFSGPGLIVTWRRLETLSPGRPSASTSPTSTPLTWRSS